jgi:6-phosphogluconolactonase
MIAGERIFANRNELAEALSADIATRLKHAVKEKGDAILAVSGGTTPKLFFDRLSRQPLEWSKVIVTLVDERQVPEESERSNARLVREMLIRSDAASARFVPLMNNPEAASLAPFDAVVLGMGNDGHTASFFPGGDRLAAALDPAAPPKIIEMEAEGAGEPRLTFTLPALLAAEYIALHIEGAEKRRVLDAALAEGPVEEMPIRAILKSDHPVTLYWCP